MGRKTLDGIWLSRLRQSWTVLAKPRNQFRKSFRVVSHDECSWVISKRYNGQTVILMNSERMYKSLQAGICSKISIWPCVLAIRTPLESWQQMDDELRGRSHRIRSPMHSTR